MGGPFTRDDQWGHPGLVDRIACTTIMACIKKYPEIVQDLLAKRVPVNLAGLGDPNGKADTYAVGGSTYVDLTNEAAPQLYIKGSRAYSNTGWI